MVSILVTLFLCLFLLFNNFHGILFSFKRSWNYFILRRYSRAKCLYKLSIPELFSFGSIYTCYFLQGTYFVFAIPVVFFYYLSVWNKQNQNQTNPRKHHSVVLNFYIQIWVESIYYFSPCYSKPFENET